MENNTDNAGKQITGAALVMIQEDAENFYPFPDGNFTDELYQKIMERRTCYENGAI